MVALRRLILIRLEHKDDVVRADLLTAVLFHFLLLLAGPEKMLLITSGKTNEHEELLSRHSSVL